MTARNSGDLQAIVDRIGIKVSSVFVPFSQSRNASEKHRSLNWKVTLYTLSPLDGQRRDILTTDYSAGVAHCPAYKASVKALGGRDSIMRDGAINYECEHGYAVQAFDNANSPNGYNIRQLHSKGNALEPNTLDVIHSLVQDADVLNASSFEDWAGDFGYDTDSRAAEKIYSACLAIALKLRNGIGDAALSELREAFAEY